MKKLWGTVHEVEDLWDQKQQESFTEMAEDAHDGENHACEIAVRVADEDAGRVPVVGEETEGDAYEGEEQVDAEAMGVCCWIRFSRVRRRQVERDYIVG